MAQTITNRSCAQSSASQADDLLGISDSLNLKSSGLKLSSSVRELQRFARAMQLARTVLPEVEKTEITSDGQLSAKGTVCREHQLMNLYRLKSLCRRPCWA